MIRNLHFLGALGDLYGHDPIRMHADNWSMIFKGMRANFPTFKRDLMKFEQIAIVKKQGEELHPVTEDMLEWNFGSAPDIYIAAGHEGAGVETFAYLGYVGWTAVAAYVATSIAISLVVGVVMKARAPCPSTSTSSAAADERKSTLFNGAENVIQQGHPVPVLYGEFQVGSVVVSTSITTDKQAI